MTADLILAIDQGTTNTKALLVDGSGRVVASASVEVPVAFPRPGWVESDATRLWDTVAEAIERVLADVETGRMAAVAIANQRESVLVWERATGRPLGPVVSWQCRRSTELCAAIRDDGAGALVHARTGLTLDPMFSATKARWLLDQVADGDRRAEAGELCVGTVDAWLTWNVSGGAAFVTDATNASRTLLLDLDGLRWDPELLLLFRIPAAALPAVRASSGVVAETRALGRLPAGVPIAALAGDSHAALVGHGFPGVGAVKATFGTGTSVMAPLAAGVRDDRLSATVAWAVARGAAPDGAADAAIDAVPALEGNITATGAALQWLAGIVGHAGRVGELETLAASVPDAGGAYLVPAFTGLGAPHWDADARGLISGLSRGTTAAHLARAAFESVGYQVRDVIDALAPAVGSPLTAVFADGGAMQSALLAQTTADILGLPMLINRAESLAALGAAYLAGLATGLWASTDEIRALPRALDRFDPDPAAPAATEGYAGWQVALRRAAGDLGTAASSAASTPTPARTPVTA
ncbi:MAG: FGGY family carbohydrate kinase [Chloroflexota bacterium]